ncbi:SapC family protein [Paraburkholderia sp. Ac-20342]|uniref:SapC family protein n=1 Tax=Paraburkholderia sp. Ac-20342 TaxID=2703889 RepID=UPI001981974B|nr:SapC family protein [Paraburkholderia sp. Ac-20342]MBN3849451.1 SapC family protein [Paraburkholderia sp. Ac-20342]
MPTMIFYDKPVALNRERHRDSKLLRQSGQFQFARDTNSVLMAGSEIHEAARHYPVVFVSAPDNQYTLAALLGLRDHENLFVDADGQWTSGAYVPAFVRRYPFVLAEGDNDQLTVCVDESYPGWNQADGECLFDDDGKDTPLLQGAVEFLKLFHGEMQRTRVFCARLAALDLLVPKTIRVERDGKQEVLNGLHVVDEDKLRGLDDAQVLDLFRDGWLAWIHAHLGSLGNVEPLARLQTHLQ